MSSMPERRGFNIPEPPECLDPDMQEMHPTIASREHFRTCPIGQSRQARAGKIPCNAALSGHIPKSCPFKQKPTP